MNAPDYEFQGAQFLTEYVSCEIALQWGMLFGFNVTNLVHKPKFPQVTNQAVAQKHIKPHGYSMGRGRYGYTVPDAFQRHIIYQETEYQANRGS